LSAWSSCCVRRKGLARWVNAAGSWLPKSFRAPPNWHASRSFTPNDTSQSLIVRAKRDYLDADRSNDRGGAITHVCAAETGRCLGFSTERRSTSPIGSMDHLDLRLHGTAPGGSQCLLFAATAGEYKGEAHLGDLRRSRSAG